ncbi:MAG: hypothetical protein DHS80DRAFT_22697 [Piptocephalis tieghemiana]|nr:MAG: hypothetical protein DHS80DRAFT_22697 [Piptocephalis tieghemiana]
MEDSAINKAHSFVALAEELEEKGAWTKAAEAHSLAAGQFQAATKDTQVEDIQRTLHMMREDHARRARQLRQSHPGSSFSLSSSGSHPPPTLPSSPRILAPRPYRRSLDPQGQVAFQGIPSAVRTSDTLALPIPSRPTSNPSPRPPPWRRPIPSGGKAFSSKRSPLGQMRILEEEGLVRPLSALSGRLDSLAEENPSLSIPLNRPVLSEESAPRSEHEPRGRCDLIPRHLSSEREETLEEFWMAIQSLIQNLPYPTDPPRELGHLESTHETKNPFSNQGDHVADVESEVKEGEESEGDQGPRSSPTLCRSPSPSESFFLVKEDYTDLAGTRVNLPFPASSSPPPPPPPLNPKEGRGRGDQMFHGPLERRDEEQRDRVEEYRVENERLREQMEHLSQRIRRMEQALQTQAEHMHANVSYLVRGIQREMVCRRSGEERGLGSPPPSREQGAWGEEGLEEQLSQASLGSISGSGEEREDPHPGSHGHQKSR